MNLKTAVKSKIRIHFIVGVFLTSLGIVEPADAAWSWKSAFLWSYSTADCTAPGTVAGAKNFAFGPTAAAANCGTSSASASALAGWGGGAGAGVVAPGTVGSFGGAEVLGPASASISAPSFTVGTTGITFDRNGTVSELGLVTAEIGAFMFTGDPNLVFGPTGSETIPSTGIAGLIDLGIITASDVLFNLKDSQIPSSFSFLPFTRSISSNEQNTVVLAAFAQTVPEIDSVSGTGAITILIGALALAGEWRRRKPGVSKPGPA